MSDLFTSMASALSALHDPLSALPLSLSLTPEDVQVQGSRVQLTLRPGYYLGSQTEAVIQQAEAAVRTLGDFERVEVRCVPKVQRHVVQGELPPIKPIQNVIMISSGKGGVGKSTTSVNVALSLARDGAKVGLLDADIYGPSVPLMMGLRLQKAQVVKGKHMISPLFAHGVWCHSIGFLIDETQPAIWRGPMVSQALEQLLRQTDWPQLDYLVVDMPPGTGDVALTLAQKTPIAGGVVVTTPQDIALIDARKGLEMLQKVKVSVLGVVENMSLYCCPHCGHQEAIFGEHGGQKMAEQLQVPFLGSLPLHPQIRLQTDSGTPTVVADPASQAAQLYRQVARTIAAQLAMTPVDTKRYFPKWMMKKA